jgi:hypothetical protein
MSGGGGGGGVARARAKLRHHSTIGMERMRRREYSRESERARAVRSCRISHAGRAPANFTDASLDSTIAGGRWPSA